MDSTQRKEVKSPRENANLLSVLSFWWILKLFVVGYKKELEEVDLYSPLKEDKSSYIEQHIVKNWEDEMKRCEKENNKSKPSLIRALWKFVGKRIIYIGLVLSVPEFGIRSVQPFILARLLHYFSMNRKDWSDEVYYYAAAFCILPLLDAIVYHWSAQSLLHVGMKVRVACCTLIYRKILKLSNSVLENETSVGQMVNLLSTDVHRFNDFLFSFHYIWIGPIHMILVTYLIYHEIGIAAVTGMIIFFLYIPLQLYIGKCISRLTSMCAQKGDERLRLMNQIIAGIETIKMYVWEVPYSRLVQQARREEIKVLKKYTIIDHLTMMCNMYIPRISLFITIITYVLTGNNIDAGKVFMATAFYNILKDSIAINFSRCIYHLGGVMVSIKRLEKFMMYSEIPEEQKIQNQIAAQSVPIYMKDITARWDESRDYTLQNVDLTVAAGNFIAVVGQIGSGKSSLLQAILGELPIQKGVLETYGKISFANQKPWLFTSSIKQNILFGQPMNEERYKEVIRICELKQDLDILVHGDKTTIGERGINLSGGQRARINLARAVYADADIYLLDDPLSAVDPHVGKRIVDECILGFLNGKTRILVTHQIQYLKAADQVIVMNNGSISAKGSFDELQDKNLDFIKILQEAEVGNVSEEAEDKGENGKIMDEIREKDEATIEKEPEDMAEMRTFGKVSSAVFFAYLKANKSMLLLLLTIFFFILSQIMGSGSSYLLAFWVNTEEASRVANGNDTTAFLSREGIIYLYSGLIVGCGFVYAIQIFTYCQFCMRISKNLHAQMFHSIVRATMYFFNTNPAGRILNRFSKDIGIIDKYIPFSLFDVTTMFLTVMATIVIVVTVSVWLLIPTFIVILMFYCTRVVYIPTSRAVTRMEGITRSPVFDHVGATLQGLTTIRAFKAEKLVTEDFNNHQDLHSSAWFVFISISRALGLYVDAFCQIYVGLVMTVFIVFDGLAVVGDIGLVITQISAISEILQWGVRQSAELENELVSVERVLEYSHLEEEPFLDSIPEKKPPDEWPTKGSVEFKDVRLKYGPKGTLVLKNINVIIKHKEKVGVVGRTGAGKTSLISALFRLANIEGEIIIDNIRTDMIALHDFRSKISIIPQEPVLFGGSLRRNLDPFDDYSDSELWDALEKVELKKMISDMAAGLDSRVADEGSNFSVGQRQLLCLVRALARNNKVIVLDEATANVDSQTDSLIQQTVRKKFVDCTVITIAHRLNTIMDSDKILVMDQGQLVEFDHPYILLKKKGYFYNMVQQTGTAMASCLSVVARNNFYKKNHASS